MNALEISLMAFAIVLGLAALTFWIATIRHCWVNMPAGSRERRLWMLIVILGKMPGAIAYHLLRGRDDFGRPGPTRARVLMVEREAPPSP